MNLSDFKVLSSDSMARNDNTGFCIPYTIRVTPDKGRCGNRHAAGSGRQLKGGLRLQAEFAGGCLADQADNPGIAAWISSILYNQINC